MIKPESVTAELAERINECVIYYDGFQVDVVKVANLLIEAGVVSPPCWAVRDEFGCVATQHRVFTAKQFAEEIFMHRPGCVAEHWKGQTE